VPPGTEKKKWNNLTAECFPGVNCGDSKYFNDNFKERFDYVIFTLANWGGKESWKKIWKSAFFALKKNGKLVFIEWKKYYEPYDFMWAFEDLGIPCARLRLSNFIFVTDAEEK
jgi:hypothetical protein